MRETLKRCANPLALSAPSAPDGGKGPPSCGSRRKLWAGIIGVIGVIALSALAALWPKGDGPRARNRPPEVLRADLVLQDGRLHRLGETTSFSGLMIERYANGGLQSRSTVFEGLLDGLSEGWFTNGQLQVSEHFKHGVSHGLRAKWYPSGSKLSEANILEGKFEGTFRKWHENGVLAEQAEFADGRPVGVSVAYYASGFLKARVTLKDGKAVEQNFWEDGQSHESPVPIGLALRVKRGLSLSPQGTLVRATAPAAQAETE